MVQGTAWYIDHESCLVILAHVNVGVYQGVSHVGCCPEGVWDIDHTRHVNNDVEHHVLLVRAMCIWFDYFNALMKNIYRERVREKKKKKTRGEFQWRRGLERSPAASTRSHVKKKHTKAQKHTSNRPLNIPSITQVCNKWRSIVAIPNIDPYNAISSALITDANWFVNSNDSDANILAASAYLASARCANPNVTRSLGWYNVVNDWRDVVVVVVSPQPLILLSMRISSGPKVMTVCSARATVFRTLFHSSVCFYVLCVCVCVLHVDINK